MDNLLDLKHPPADEPSPSDEVAADDGAEPMLGFLAAPAELEWEARHTLSERGRYRHYLAFAGFALAGGVVSWWQASWLTFLTVFLGLAAWELHEHLGRPVRVRVDERGVSVNGRHYPHAALSSFDLHRMPDGAVELSLATRDWHWQRLRLPLGEQDPDEVRTALLHYVAEESHGIPLIDWLIRK